MTEAYQGGEVLAEVVRSDYVEGFHRGSAVVLGADGKLQESVGDIESDIFPRSSNKPMQAIGALRSGLDFADPADLALAAASHRGEPFHVGRVSAILERCGLTANDLRCPAALPIDDDSQRAILAAGGGPTRLHMNCSGKHAAMLSACVTSGLSTKDYLDPDHDLQQANKAAVEEFSGCKITTVGIDGCGAPLYALPLLGLARAFLRIADAEANSPARSVADAMRARPDLVSGTHGADTLLMRAVPSLLAKSGAEGVCAVAVPGVGAVALKIDDGTSRARTPVAIAALRKLGLTKLDVDELALDDLSTAPVYGGNARGGSTKVGSVRPVWPAAS